MELSELTNRELKNILRQNQVKNYSKLNKKELVKKVNNLIKVQNGGKNGKGKNGNKKKYTLKDLIGGLPGEPGEPVVSKTPVPTGVNSTILPNVIINGKAPPPPPNPPPASNQVETTELIVHDAPGNAPGNATVKAPGNATGNATRNITVNATGNASREKNATATLSAIATAPNLSQNEIRKLENNEEARKLNQVNNKGKNECGACSIL